MILYGYAKGRGLERIGTIGPEDTADYLRAVQHLRSVDHSTILLTMVHRSIYELRDIIDKIGKHSPLATEDGWEEMTGLEIELDRVLLNFLSSFRTYLDHTATRLSRTYGTSSTERQAFDKATSNAYDRSFGYRFLYKLRNYIQHMGFPDWNPLTDGTAPDGSVMRFFGLLEATADPQELLDRDTDVWGSLREELSSLPVRIQIGACADEVVEELDTIDKWVRDVEDSALRASAEVVERVVAPALERGLLPMPAQETEVNGKPHLTFIGPPATLMSMYSNSFPTAD